MKYTLFFLHSRKEDILVRDKSSSQPKVITRARDKMCFEIVEREKKKGKAEKKRGFRFTRQGGE